MSSKDETRRHESGHAIVALALGIGLHENAMVFVSDTDAWTNVAFSQSPQPDESWCIRRAAVKLAGPIAMIRSRGQAMEWATLASECEYHADYNQAEQCLQNYWLAQGYAAEEYLVQTQLENAASMSIECVLNNEAAIVRLTEATDGHDKYSRQQALEAIGEYLPLRTPSLSIGAKDTK